MIKKILLNTESLFIRKLANYIAVFLIGAVIVSFFSAIWYGLLFGYKFFDFFIHIYQSGLILPDESEDIFMWGILIIIAVVLVFTDVIVNRWFERNGIAYK